MAEANDFRISLTSDMLLAYRFIEESNAPVFLTGKAGTGKTTFLRYLQEHTDKSYAVVAPTAVAAINAGGVTLHSFFQIPRGPLMPGNHQFSYSQEKRQLLKCLELLIIDEISMVRADALDHIDQALRFARASERPFGGIQLLMVGDLFQLPPVYEQDWPILSTHYRTPFFFSAAGLSSLRPVTFELKDVFRQTDEAFIAILNAIRTGSADDGVFSKLNQRYLKEFTLDDGYTTLTTHNETVALINQEHLRSLEGEIFTFRASISGDFPKDGYPADEELLLKNGAQVIFIKNDASGKKQYYNGRKATIIALSASQVRVRFLDDHTELELVQEVWQHVKYDLSKNAEKVIENNAGTFTQYPLKLAWAITVHKSQGLTFDQVIIDVERAFAHGQTYVALSRCRTLGGITLRAPIRPENLLTRSEITDFMQSASENPPDEVLLQKCIRDFENGLVRDLFDFTFIGKQWARLEAMMEDEPEDAKTAWRHGLDLVNSQLVPVGDRFIRKDLASTELLTAQFSICERMAKAATFFTDQLVKFAAIVRSMNSLLKGDGPFSILNVVLEQIVLRGTLLKSDFVGLKSKDILAVTHQQAVSFKPLSRSRGIEKVEKEIINPQIFAELMNWRTMYCKARAIPEYSVISEKLIKAIAAKNPDTLAELAAIKGIGPQKAADIGPEIIILLKGRRGEQSLF